MVVALLYIENLCLPASTPLVTCSDCFGAVKIPESTGLSWNDLLSLSNVM